MIAALIQWCVHNRAMVMMLTVFLILAGVWSASNLTVDAIPDLSDVQVVIRTEFPGQAPQIIEDQVTYPLTTTMMAVPFAKTVRGYSMFGTSFVYIIFEDGTDMYWARSRVLEQLSFAAGQLPLQVAPQLGPDATGVGWAYEYVLVTGNYCPKHPNGLWHDPDTDQWYDDMHNVPEDPKIIKRLARFRVFPEGKTVYFDQQEGRRYDTLDSVPQKARGRVNTVQLVKGYERCPFGGTYLLPSDQDLSDLRGLQDWYLRFELTAVDGVSEVAPIGGFIKQYQVVVDPVKLLAYNIPLHKVKTAIGRSNIDVGGRLVEVSETEYMVRGMGYLGNLSAKEIIAARAAGQSLEKLRTQRVLEDLGKISLGATEDGIPIYLSSIAQVRIGPEIRRGVAEWNGEGEAVGGVVVMRFGENAKAMIKNTRAKLADLEKGLPPGVAIKVGYDRSDLIQRAVNTVTWTLGEEIIIVFLVIIIFLLHARSALVAFFVLPIGVAATLTIMYLLDINANIMSLGGIALSIGVMVDSSIVMVENGHKHLEQEKQRVAHGEKPRLRIDIIGDAAAQVGPTLFFSLLIITVSFLPIFVLGEQAGRLFKPLAYTKTFAMGSAAVLAVTVIPVLMIYFIRERMVPLSLSRPKRLMIYGGIILVPAIVMAMLSALDYSRLWLVIGCIFWIIVMGFIVLPQRIYHEDRTPPARLLQWMYQPFFVFVMHHRWLTLIGSLALIVATLWPFGQLGSEFMPPLEEGDLLYMPTTDPGISLTKAREMLQQMDKMIMQFPEVKSVLGKIGRAETATDPAPPSMVETTITLHRDKEHWRQAPRSFDNWPPGTQWLGLLLQGAERPITIKELVYGYNWPDGTHVPGLNEVVQLPGVTNAWTMPIKTRIDMLSTGIKTPVGIKVMGPDLRTLADLADQIANVVKIAEGTGPYTTSAFAEKSVGGNYFDFKINRNEIARYGLSLGDVQDVIMTAMGGMTIGNTVEGLERYPINIRYPHELRDNIDALRQTLVATPAGAQVPIGQLAQIQIHKGPPMIKSENARLTSWIFVDIAGLDVGTYVSNAQRAVAAAVKLPAGYNIVWSGQYEYMEAARKRLIVVVPLAGVLILLLLYMATKSWLRVAILVLSLPFSLVGAVWLLYILQYNLSLAVWVGVIALAGLAVETGLVLLMYLDNSFEQYVAEGRMRNTDDLWHAIHEGAVQRVRPITMTTMTTFIGLVTLMFTSGAGADTMRRLAAPMVGGLATAYIGVLLLYPVIFYLVKRIALHHTFAQGARVLTEQHA